MKNIEGPVVIGGDNLPSPVGIGLTELLNIAGASGPLVPPVPASLKSIVVSGSAECGGCAYEAPDDFTIF